MGFCPVPHTARDQVWLGVGALLGAGIVYLTRPASSSQHPKHVSPLAHGPVRVCVEFNDVADPDKFKLLYKDLVIGSRTKDKGCVQYDLLQSTKDPKQFRMIEAWATQKDLDVHGGATPWMTEKRKKQESPEFKECVPASVNVDLSYVNVF